MMTKGLHGLNGSIQDICVIGAGPVGIALALELSRRGRSVLLLESGDIRATTDAQRLSDADILDPKVHVAMDLAVHRGLGGASNLWGGRCVSLEPIDFETRAGIPHSGWPIGMQDLAAWLPQACAYIGCGAPVFESKLPGTTFSDPDFRFERIERWSRQPRFNVMHAQALRENRAIDLRVCATVTSLAFAADGRVADILARGADGSSASFKARAIVLAAGGLE
ncbi:MAG TPA: FAD-dependent oxidoreductase, partial [Rhodopila sp.]|nr:FAD-dependent oxidoreductase [Rhodopila sp.]